MLHETVRVVVDRYSVARKLHTHWYVPFASFSDSRAIPSDLASALIHGTIASNLPKEGRRRKLLSELFARVHERSRW